MNASSISDHARQVLEFAKEEALRWKHDHVGTEHLLLGIVKEPDEMTKKVLDAFGLSPHQIHREVEKFMQAGPDRVSAENLVVTRRAGKAYKYSWEEAWRMNHPTMGAEHLLLGLLLEQEGIAAMVLMNLGVTLEGVRGVVSEHARQTGIDEQDR